MLQPNARPPASVERDLQVGGGGGLTATIRFAGSSAVASDAPSGQWEKQNRKLSLDRDRYVHRNGA